MIVNLINKLIKTKKIKQEDIFIVTGFKANLIKKTLSKKFNRVNYIYNKYFQKREMLYSMLLAMRKIDEDFVCMYSDILISQKTINKLILDKTISTIKLPILKY